MPDKILFLDDNEERHNQFLKSIGNFPVICVRTVEECIEVLKNEKIKLFFVDHDLNQEVYVNVMRKDCGSEVIRWLLNNQDRIPKRIIAHTHNLKAAKFMQNMIPHIEIKPFGTFKPLKIILEME